MGLQGMVCWGKSSTGGTGLSLVGVGMMPEEWKAWSIFLLISVQDKKCGEIRNCQIAKPRQPGESFAWAVVKHPPRAVLNSLSESLLLAQNHPFPVLLSPQQTSEG